MGCFGGLRAFALSRCRGRGRIALSLRRERLLLQSFVEKGFRGGDSLGGYQEAFETTASSGFEETVIAAIDGCLVFLHLKVVEDRNCFFLLGVRTGLRHVQSESFSCRIKVLLPKSPAQVFETHV